MTLMHKGGGSGRHRRVVGPAGVALTFESALVDGPEAQREAAAAVREVVDALAFAEDRWDREAWTTAHGAALELVVLLTSVDPNTAQLLAAAATTLDQARTAFENAPRPTADA
ncbi:MAG: hypothetical protein HOV68_32745, partial [Streptomycetaceae bacterium]|nr:hypothetical protein [Streptomycetaceae bacterium]